MGAIKNGSNKLLNWVKGLLNDENGVPSSKRLLGLISGLSLCATMVANSFTDITIAPSDALVNAVAALAFGALGLTSVDKIWGGRNNTDSE
jgi:hypothetical protein